MSTHKLVYFDMMGRAENIRILLHMAGIQFEDVRLTGDQFKEQKAKGEFKNGQVPVLEIDGKQYSQSWALTQYAAQKAGIWPKDHIKELEQVEFAGLLLDMVAHIAKIFPLPDGEEKENLRKIFASETFVQYEEIVRKTREENKGKFMFGDDLSVGDISWYTLLTGLMSVNKYIAPKIQDLLDAVRDHPKIQAYYKK